MRLPFSILNAFIEDSCVIVVIAYVLARGRLLNTLLSDNIGPRRALVLGGVLGAVGLSEVVFPGARAPYVVHTLLITFAVLTGGAWVGATAAFVVLIGVAVLRPPPGPVETALTLLTIALAALMVRSISQRWNRLTRAAVAGTTAQALVVLVQSVQAATVHPFPTVPYSVVSIAANGFGLFLLQLILQEAQTRAESEQNRIELERSRTLIAQAQLAALRARVHPHFLFNALTSVAVLCRIAPADAEATVLRLGQLMRRALEANPTAPVCLAEEISIVRDYLEIEQQRLGSRLRVAWSVDERCLNTPVPSFALQTLVENAVIHGVARSLEPSEIRVVVRRRKASVMVVVRDTGVGMSADILRRVRQGQGEQHGLSIVNGQLQLLYGRSHRLRLWSQADNGTCVAFALPAVRRELR